MRTLIGKILCWFGYHVEGELIEFPHHENDDYPPGYGMQRTVLLTYCKRCGEGPFRIT